jgi:hypothetical protein
MPQKSTDPRDRLGVFKRYADVPAEYRLDQHEAEYADRDVWEEFVESRRFEHDSTHYWNTFEKTGKSWRTHTATRGRHHALAHPRDVESWYVSLVETRTLGTVHSEYAYRLIEFYDWLQWHAHHPHTYHPPLQAALTYPTARRLWEVAYGPVGGSDE